MRKIGLFCGTFNPFHLGHKNIYEKALRLFDDVIVCQGINPDKSSQSVVPSLEHLYPIKVSHYEGLTTDLIISWNKSKTDTQAVLIRGIRNGYDYDYEMNQISVMRDIYPSLDVVLIPCDREYAHISSTMIRNLNKLSAYNQAEKYLP